MTIPDDTPADPTDNPTRRYLYESPHLAHGLTGIIDENGNRFATFEYDEQGRAVMTTHAGDAGRNTVIYGQDETTVTGPLGKDTTYVFEEIQDADRLVRVDGHASANCPATQTTNSYDDRGFVTQKIDPNGNTTQYTYTHTGLPTEEYLYHVGLATRITEAVGTAAERTTEIEWHPEFRLPAKIIEPGRTTTLTYNDDARLIRRRSHGAGHRHGPGLDLYLQRRRTAHRDRWTAHRRCRRHAPRLRRQRQHRSR
ncbi:MAG: RHS repeat protein [Gammaproteobacteria bacterium]|nr:RHS repeat protein [Gammaproteobacteria bacterium]